MKKLVVLLMLALAAARGEERVIKIISVKHRPAETLYSLLPRGPELALSSVNRELNTITLQGPAESVKAAEAIIQQYDTPRKQAEFVIRVIEAGPDTKGPNDAADLVPAELKSLLRYSRYGLWDSAIIRGMESDKLHIELAGNLSGGLNFRVRETQPSPLIELAFNISVMKGTAEKPFREDLLSTTSTAKNGETVVLGASKMRGGSTALIVLLTPKLLP